MIHLSAEQLTALLQEMMARIDHDLPEMRPIEVSLKDPTPREAKTKKEGIIRKATFDLDKDVYDWLMNDIPETAILRGIVWLEDAPEPSVEKKTEKKERKKKPAAGPHGKFWEELFLSGFWGKEVVQRLLEMNAENWRDLLHLTFEKQSTTEISPDDFMQWITRRADACGYDHEWNGIECHVEKVIESMRPIFAPGQYFAPGDLK